MQHSKCKLRNSFRWVCTHTLTWIACSSLKKCDNGPLGWGHQILSAEKSPGSPGFAVLSTAPLTAPPLYTHVYICNISSQKWFTAALQHHLLRWASKTYFCSNTEQLCFQRHTQAVGLGQHLSFHTFMIQTCFISPAQDLTLQPQEFCLRFLTVRYHYGDTICCSPFFLKSKYKNKNTWLRTWAQGEQIPFCSLPPLLVLFNSHCLQTSLRKKQLQ